jgi:hypothetical protein
MAAGPVEDAWMEKCLITIQPIGGTAMQFESLTETVDLDLGEKKIEGIALVNGGRIRRWSPQSDGKVTFEAYPLGAGTSSGSVGAGFHDLMHTKDATAPIRVANDYNRLRHRVALLWTNDPTPTTATAVTADTFFAYRVVAAEVIFTKVTPSFTDGILKFTIEAMWTAFDKAASANCIEESCAGASGTDILPAIAVYSTTNKFA